nr:MaoC family dehydratase N-terminal domain-containing protein [Rhodococcus pyridinivorans]
MVGELGSSLVSESHSFTIRYLSVVPIGSEIEVTTTRTPEGAEASLTADGVLAATVRLGTGPVADTIECSIEDEVTLDFCVEFGAVHNFARATRWPEMITVEGIAPPTFLAAVTNVLPHPDPIDRIGFDRPRTLVGETFFAFPNGPVRVGEKLDIREYVTNRKTREGSRGTMEFADLVTEFSDTSGLRAIYRNTFILMPEHPDPSADIPRPARLAGSRDPLTRDTFYPARQYSVDGTLRECEPVDLSTEGVLYAFTTYGDQDFGQVDLPEGVRIQMPLEPGDHQIGATYRLVTDDNQGWCFTRA